MVQKIIVYSEENKLKINIPINQDINFDSYAKNKLNLKDGKYVIKSSSDLPEDQSTRDAWYLAEDGTIQIDQAKLDAQKPLATGPGFIQFTKKQLEIQNVANNVPSDQRVQIFQTIKSKLSNWQNTTQKNYWDFLEQMQTPFIDSTWNDFKADIFQNKNLPENLINIQTSQGNQSLGGILLFYMGLYESETRFLSKEEFEEKYVQ